MNKLISKLFRQKLRDDISFLIKEVGFRDLTESHIGNYVYSGKGHISTGLNSIPVDFRLKLNRDHILVTMKNNDKSVNIKYDAYTKKDLMRFPSYFHSHINGILN